MNSMDAIEYFKGMRKRLCEDHLKLLPKKSVGYQTTLREMSFYDAAIEAIERKPCEDCISREEALKIMDWGWKNGIYPSNKIAAIPSVTPQPKTGHWIRMKAYEKWGCSECYTVFRFTFKEHYYCPNCGAKMEVE